MWKLVGGKMKWVAIGVAAVEAGKLAIDEFLPEDSAVRETVDNAGNKVKGAVVGGVESMVGLDNLRGGFKSILPFITQLDGFFSKIFGGDHFLGKMIAGMLPEEMLTPNDRAKLLGTTPAEEWSANFMKGFKAFDAWNDPKALQEMGQLARDQGFTGNEFGKGSLRDSLDVASWAGKLGFKNSAEMHFMMELPQVAAAGDLDAFIKAQISAGKGDDAHEIAVNMGYRSESEIEAAKANASHGKEAGLQLTDVSRPAAAQPVSSQLAASQPVAAQAAASQPITAKPDAVATVSTDIPAKKPDSPAVAPPRSAAEDTPIFTRNMRMARGNHREAMASSVPQASAEAKPHHQSTLSKIGHAIGHEVKEAVIGHQQQAPRRNLMTPS